VVCSQAISLHGVPGLECLGGTVQRSSTTSPPGAAPDPGPTTAAASTAAQAAFAAAMRASGYLLPSPADMDKLSSETDAPSPSRRDPLGDAVNDLADDAETAEGPTAAAFAPKAARFLTVVYICRVSSSTVLLVTRPIPASSSGQLLQ
jgi:hypothetical protein